ncbi:MULTISPECIES: hypothetical protein [unclassified Mesorhizobium]|uniref:hypothetical protein n=1 Tax=unclassified Mesorhizobium TaxID=325217 RepID=UPI000BAECA8C|nr:MULTISPECIES: hypothetical protein [unclassified Mesorhizobium]TGT61122.1 hypothetical protein EN813_019410 [Mesorhizobium sp. M00.F.Ca.ET.170.01.1.1]AZO08892.1 hypothetical protein EJ074_07035 [Mesorhizobium sp. M3A.F.Ca.ET.080.04.2.1]PBB84302.1 hypothetical protein CK216_24520 [Mesorhizobium sp. WSM3876]RWB67488.1 MAG: hypothetical protein EOQ49_25895 [Mesorhizobium sp.]RWB84640.1 MAG: hypothetical protein EOQ52_24000 [Mesorhizobium sp.]
MRPLRNQAEPDLSLQKEAERQARFEKNARLRELRTHASWLVLDPQAPFHDEIDCSVLFRRDDR